MQSTCLANTCSMQFVYSTIQILYNLLLLVCTRCQRVCKINANKVLNKYWAPKSLNLYIGRIGNYDQTTIDDGKVV